MQHSPAGAHGSYVFLPFPSVALRAFFSSGGLRFNLGKSRADDLHSRKPDAPCFNCSEGRVAHVCMRMMNGEIHHRTHVWRIKKMERTATIPNEDGRRPCASILLPALFLSLPYFSPPQKHNPAGEINSAPCLFVRSRDVLKPRFEIDAKMRTDTKINRPTARSSRPCSGWPLLQLQCAAAATLSRWRE